MPTNESLSSRQARTPMPSRKPSSGPIFAVLLAGATFIAGYILGSTAGAKIGLNNGAQESVSMAETRAKLGLPPAATELHSLGGTISGVSALGFTLAVPANGFMGIEASTRTVKITATTKITITRPLTAAELQAQRKAYDESIAKASKKDAAMPPTPPPVPYVSRVGTVADLKDGMYVTVASNENIISVSSFEATDVTAQELPAAADTKMPNAPVDAGTTPDAHQEPAPVNDPRK